MSADHYSIMGLSPSATKEEVKAAFRKYALQHHPDLHINSPEAVKRQSEATFAAIKKSYEAIVDANFVYRDARSPGRAGFHRSAYNGPYSSYYSNTSYQGQHTRTGHMHFSQRMASEMRTFWRAFTSSGSASLTAALGGMFLGGFLFLEPLFSSAWERNNEGKLFKQIEMDVVERKKAQLVAMQAARATREAATAKAAAAAVMEAALVIEDDKLLSNETNSSLFSTHSTVVAGLKENRPAAAPSLKPPTTPALPPPSAAVTTTTTK